MIARLPLPSKGQWLSDDLVGWRAVRARTAKLTVEQRLELARKA
jgi:hypothetical protein